MLKKLILALGLSLAIVLPSMAQSVGTINWRSWGPSRIEYESRYATYLGRDEDGDDTYVKIYHRSPRKRDGGTGLLLYVNTETNFYTVVGVETTCDGTYTEGQLGYSSDTLAYDRDSYFIRDDIYRDLCVSAVDWDEIEVE